MSLLHAISYGATAAALLFATLSLANGLLWLAELIEEHSRIAKVVGKRTVYAVIAFHVLLYIFDSDLPFTHITFSVVCHLVYLLNFRKFPLVTLTSWSFRSSCFMVIADHFLWFFHFREIVQQARKRGERWRRPMEPVPHIPTFLDISTFFGICVWLVPLFLFLSLSANDNALPTASRHGPSTTSMPAFDLSQPSSEQPQRSSLLVSLSTKALSLLPCLRLPRRLSQRSSDGLIAPQFINPSHQDPVFLCPELHQRPISLGPLSTTTTPSSLLRSPLASLNSATEPIDGRPTGADKMGTRQRARSQVP